MRKARSYPQNMQNISRRVVGIEPVLKEVISILKSVDSLGLTGMGGLGKTTLAKRLFNEIGCDFEYSCFVPDVKLIPGSAEDLKKEVWKFMYRKGQKVGEAEEWSQLRGKPVLLVLDDVSKEQHVKPFLEMAEAFSEESRVIATSRERDVFNSFADSYPVPFLDESSAKQLFRSHAFGGKEIPPNLESLTEDIVRKSEYLPLTLEVLGQFLKKRRDVKDWKQTLAALDEADSVDNFNERLWTKLRPSIDGLAENEKNMFLDATTFFTVLI
jgi:hypothetical protein